MVVVSVPDVDVVVKVVEEVFVLDTVVVEPAEGVKVVVVPVVGFVVE